jgi:hypothetical protein
MRPVLFHRTDGNEPDLTPGCEITELGPSLIEPPAGHVGTLWSTRCEVVWCAQMQRDVELSHS